ncbi:hypothetical protein [Tardiphaga sp.]|jgi:hypothetical protein|uniref:hypothetical protein n=1 Tax=Tardiphaga sp. TaxID=1926292 RepID=UPI0037DA562C
MELTGFQWAQLVFMILGFLITAGGVVAGCVWAVARVEKRGDERANAERERSDQLMKAHQERTALAMKDLASELAAEQKTQASVAGEMGMALRRYIEGVEKEMHKIEIWGRDNYVLKSDFLKATDRLEETIKELAVDIKKDFRELMATLSGRGE